MKLKRSLLCGVALSLCLGAAAAASEDTTEAASTEAATEAVSEAETAAAADNEDDQALASEAQEASEAAETESMATGITIGVITYNPDEGQTMAFRKYLQEYVGPAFNTQFYYSEACSTEEEEHAFVEDLHARGVRGMIGTPQYMSTMELCEEYGIYFVYGAASASDEEFEELKDNEYFLGTISSTLEDEQASGKDMAVFFADGDEEQSRSYVILSGGASMENEMHKLRTQGMLEGLAESYGITYETSAEELAQSADTTEVVTGCDVKITIIPGYPDTTPLEDTMQGVAEDTQADVIMSVVSADYVIEGVRAAEETTGKDIKVGAVDCFTDNAYDLFNGVYSGGKQELDYLVGRYGAGMAPAFVAIANAYAGYAEDFRDNGEPFRLTQDFWTASDLDTFNELYGLSVGVAENIYSADGMMQVLKEFNPDATFEDYKAFVEAPNEE